MSLCIRRFPNKFMNVTLWVLVFSTIRFLDSARFSTPTPLSLLILCKLSFLIVRLKMTSLPTLALKSANKIFMWYLGIYRIHVLVPLRTCLSYHQFYLLLGHEHSQRSNHTSDLLVSCTTYYQ
jgi:hypothetical protein